MLNICAKLLKNSSIHKGITAWTWKHAHKHWNCKLTLTFQIGCGSFSRHIVLICQTIVPNYFKILPCISKLQTGLEWLHINNQAKSATLTFKIGAWFFHTTHSLDMLRELHNGITAQTRKHAYKHWNCKCNLDLWDRGVVMTHLLDMPNTCAKLF